MDTSNNSVEMNTQVETFLIEETVSLIYDGEQLDKWSAHVKELGLKGQTKIVQGEKSPIPFMHMKQTVVRMFEVLCPRKVDVAEYDITPIPVEILDLIALARREKHFHRIEIWYDDKSLDPVCVGINSKWYERKDEGYNLGDLHTNREDAVNAMKSKGVKGNPVEQHGSAVHYLLGKWADVKASFAELRERARQRYITEQGAQIRKEIKDAERKLDDLEQTAIEQFGA